MPKHGDIAVSSLLGNQEATMNSAVTRSVAIFLDQLGEKYNQQLLSSDYANDETFKTLFVERLRQAVEKYKVQFDEGIIGYVATLLERSQISQLDIVGEKVYPIKDVLKLVFLACCDEGVYADKSDEGTNSRLLTLYNTLRKLSLEGRCSGGTRHELVGVLLGVYPGTKNIIQSYSAHIEYLAIDFLQSKFDKIDDAHTKHAIVEQWPNLEGEEFTAFINSIKENLRKYLSSKFKKLGHDPEQYAEVEAAINDYVENLQARAMLPAAIANRYAVLELRNGLKPNPYPHLTIAAREKIVVAISPPEDPAPSSAALATRVDINVTNATAQQILRVEGILQGYAEKLNRFLPDSTKHQEALIALKSIYEKFYSVMSQPGSSQVSDDEIDRLNQIIEAAIKEQNQTIDAEIYNFFALYYSVPSIQERENLKQKILGLRDQIVLSDESLQTLMRNCAPDGKIYLTPREINQVFLTALLVDPAVWTESFASFLLHVIKFVRGEEFSSHLGLELQRSSYGDGLLNSLTTLYIFRCAHVSTTANLDILNLVVLDQQINKHYREFWNYFATLVNLPDIGSIKEARRPIFIFLLILLMTKDVVCGADKLLTQQNVNAICCNVKYASEIARALYKLDSENILTPDNFDAIINNVRYAPEMAIAFCALNAADILTLGNRDAIIRNVQYVDSIASELSALRNAHMLTQGNFNVIINNAQYVPLITDALDYLRRVNIFTQDTFDAIIRNAQYARGIVYALENLSEDGILEQGNFDAIINNARYAPEMAIAFCFLNAADILTLGNRDAIINNAQYAGEIASALRELKRAGILDPTNRNRDAIIRNVQYVDSIASALSALRNAHMLTQGNFNVIINNAQYVPLITYALENLRRVNILTQDTFDAIIRNAQYADEVYRAPDNVFLTERSFQEFCDGVRQAHQPSPSSLTVPGQSITFWQADRRDDRDQDASAPAELLPGQAQFLKRDKTKWLDADKDNAL